MGKSFIKNRRVLPNKGVVVTIDVLGGYFDMLLIGLNENDVLICAYESDVSYPYAVVNGWNKENIKKCIQTMTDFDNDYRLHETDIITSDEYDHIAGIIWNAYQDEVEKSKV